MWTAASSAPVLTQLPQSIRELSFRGYGDDCPVLQKIDLLDFFILFEVCREDIGGCPPTCCCLGSVGWSIFHGNGWCWLALLSGSTEPDLRASPAEPPAHSPLTNFFWKWGMTVEGVESSCWVQEVVPLIFMFYTEIIRSKIPWSIFLKSVLLLLWCLFSTEY